MSPSGKVRTRSSRTWNVPNLVLSMSIRPPSAFLTGLSRPSSQEIEQGRLDQLGSCLERGLVDRLLHRVVDERLRHVGVLGFGEQLRRRLLQLPEPALRRLEAVPERTHDRARVRE